MQATREQLDTLRKLQEVDRLRIKSELDLGKLPQPAQAAEVRKKLEAVAQKLAQVRSMHDEAYARMETLSAEDDRLSERQEELQAQISGSQDDYRKVASITRDLEGVAKRRETVEFEMGKADARLQEIDKVIVQATGARDALARQEAALAAAYREEGGALKAQAEQAQAERSELVELLPSDIVTEYERILDRCGGVALSYLDGSTCSACRSSIDPDRVLHIRSEAPLSHCPYCGRLIIID